MKYTAILPLILLALDLSTTASFFTIVSASPENWSEVARFTGTGSVQPQNTSDFTVSHAEWRIIWNYTYDPGNATIVGFVVSTYPREPPGDMVSFIFSIGGSPTSGTDYVSNHTGAFYMTIAAPLQVTSYSLIVQQDLDSIPEFPSHLIALSLALASASFAITVRRKRKPRKTQRLTILQGPSSHGATQQPPSLHGVAQTSPSCGQERPVLAFWESVWFSMALQAHDKN